jgi:TIR domain
MAFDAFISYANRDKAAADAACAVLERAGVRCWIAPRDVRPGEEYGDAIIEAIGQCRVMVLIFSSSANDSRQVHREIERAVSKGVAIIPVRIEEVTPTRSMEYFLGAIHWLDALTPPLENHLERLAEAVKAVLQIEVMGSATRRHDSSEPLGSNVAGRAPGDVQRDRGALWLAQTRRFVIPALGGACIALLIAGIWLYRLPEPSSAQALNLTRSAESGIDSLIAYERAWDGNCNALPIEVRITKNPVNGTVSVLQSVTSTIPPTTPASGSTGSCAGKTVTGNEIKYKSKAGFRGTDSVSYDVVSDNRPPQLRMITINVK